MFKTIDGKSLFTDANGTVFGAAAEVDVSAKYMDRVSMEDLFVEDARGKRGIDRRAFYFNDSKHNDRRHLRGTENKGKRGIFIGGTPVYGERTPSGHAASAFTSRISTFADGRAPTKKDKRTLIGPDGKIEHFAEQRSMIMSELNAIMLPAEQSFIGGSDFDADNFTVAIQKYAEEHGLIRSDTEADVNDLVNEAHRLIEGARADKGKELRTTDVVNELLMPLYNNYIAAKMAEFSTISAELPNSYRREEGDPVTRFNSRPDAVMDRTARYSLVGTPYFTTVSPNMFNRDYFSSHFDVEAKDIDRVKLEGQPRTANVLGINSASRDGNGSASHLIIKGKSSDLGSIVTTQNYWDHVNKLNPVTEGERDYVRQSLVRPKDTLDPRNIETNMKRSDSVKDASGARSITVSFLNRLNLINVGDLWEAVRGTIPETEQAINDEDAPIALAPPSGPSQRLLINWVMKLSNLTFDEEKAAMFSRAGFTSYKTPKYLAGLLTRNWQSQEELQAYHDAWMLWVNTAEGKALEDSRFAWPLSSEWKNVQQMYDRMATLASAATPAFHIPTSIHEAMGLYRNLTKQMTDMANSEGAVGFNRTFVTAARYKLSEQEKFMGAYSGTVYLTNAFSNRYFAEVDEAAANVRNADKPGAHDKAVADRKMLLSPDAAARSLEHTWDIAAGHKWLFTHSPKTYRKLVGLSDAEVLTLVHVAWSGLVARVEMPLKDISKMKPEERAAESLRLAQSKTGPIRSSDGESLAGNRAATGLFRDHRSDKDNGTRYTSWLRARNMDANTDRDFLQDEFLELTQARGVIQVNVDRRRGKSQVIELTPRELCEMLVLYNAITANPTSVRGQLYGGFGYLFAKSWMDDFMKLRTAAMDGQIPESMFKSIVRGGRQPAGALTGSTEVMRSRGFYNGFQHPGMAWGLGTMSTKVTDWATGNGDLILESPDPDPSHVTSADDLEGTLKRRGVNMFTDKKLNVYNPIASETGGVIVLNDVGNLPRVIDEMVPELKDVQPNFGGVSTESEDYLNLVTKRRKALEQVDKSGAVVTKKVAQQIAGGDPGIYDRLPESAGQVMLGAVEQEKSVGNPLRTRLLNGWDHATAEERESALLEVFIDTAPRGSDEQTRRMDSLAAIQNMDPQLKRGMAREVYLSNATTTNIHPLTQSVTEHEANLKTADAEIRSGGASVIYDGTPASAIAATPSTPVRSLGKAENAFTVFSDPDRRHIGIHHPDDGTTVTEVIGRLLPYLGPKMPDSAASGSAAHDQMAYVMQAPEVPVQPEYDGDITYLWKETIRTVLAGNGTKEDPGMFPPNEYHYVTESNQDSLSRRGDTSMSVGDLWGIADLVLINKKTGEYVIIDYKRLPGSVTNYDRVHDNAVVSVHDQHRAQIMAMESMMDQLGFTREQRGYLVHYDTTSISDQWVDQVEETISATELAFMIAANSDIESIITDPARMAVRQQIGVKYNQDPLLHLPPGEYVSADEFHDPFKGTSRVPVIPGFAHVRENMFKNLKHRGVAAAEHPEELYKLMDMHKYVYDIIDSLKKAGGLPVTREFATHLINSPLLVDIIKPRRRKEAGRAVAMEQFGGLMGGLKTRMLALNNSLGDAQTRDARALDELGRLLSAVGRVQRTMIHVYTMADNGVNLYNAALKYHGNLPDVVGLGEIAAPEPVIATPGPLLTDPVTGLPDITEAYAIKRLVSPSQYIHESLRPMFRGVGMRSIVGNRDLESIPTAQLGFAGWFQYTHGTVDGVHITDVNEDDQSGSQWKFNEYGDQVQLSDTEKKKRYRSTRVNTGVRFSGDNKLDESQAERLQWTTEQCPAASMYRDDRVDTGVTFDLDNLTDENSNRFFPTEEFIRSIKPGESTQVSRVADKE
jgi:hypothetical protein